jgi:hypothetical protein
MTAIGHEELTRAIQENLERRATHTKEVHSEQLPEGLRVGVLKLIDRVQASEAALVEAAQTISALNMKLIEAEERISVVEGALLRLADEANKRLGAAA